MTSTNLPPNPDDSEVLRSLEDLLRQRNEHLPMQERLQRDHQRALRGLTESFVKFASPMVRLQNSIQRMDETNRKITQMGTTYTKLQRSLEKNSNVLDQNLVSNRALIAEIAKNYERGVRINNGALTDLTQEMIGTGQDLTGLRKMNADQVLQTGNNTAAVQQINKTNKEVSDKFGVSNDRLIQSLNSLKSSMDDASFFGPEAVTSFKDIATELKGRAGGADVEGGLRALFGVLAPGSENIAASRLLGAGGLRQRMAGGGGIGTGDLGPIFENLERILGSSQGEFGADIAAARTGLPKQQLIQLMQLNNIMKSDFEISKNAKATENERFNNLKNLQEKQNDWYDNGAVEMLGVLGSIETGVLIQAANAVKISGLAAFDRRGSGRGRPGQSGGVLDPATGTTTFPSDSRSKGRMGGFGGRVRGTSLRKGFGGGMAGAGIGLMAGQMTGADTTFTAGGAMLGSLIPGLGTGIGALVGLGIDSVRFLAKMSDASSERVKQEKEKIDKERAFENSKEIQRIKFLTGYLRSRAGVSLMEDDEMKEMTRQLVGLARKADEKKRNTSAGR